MWSRSRRDLKNIWTKCAGPLRDFRGQGPGRGYRPVIFCRSNGLDVDGTKLRRPGDAVLERDVGCR